MAVEIEEVGLFGLFFRNGKVMQIREEHFPVMPLLLAELNPIPIDPTRLWKLGFNRNMTTEVSYKAWQGVTLYLKPGTLSRWVIQFEGIPKAGFLQYIHQVQRLWFSLFGEHLYIPKGQPEKKHSHKIKEDRTIIVPIGERRLHTKYNQKTETIHIPAKDEPYYLSWDSRLLFRTGRIAIWRVGPNSPLFQFKGRPWGLVLIHGQSSEEDRIHAGKWLHEYMEANT